MLDVVHALAADHAGPAARMSEALASAAPPVAEPLPNRETWGTTPDAVAGQRAMEDLFAAKPRKQA